MRRDRGNGETTGLAGGELVETIAEAMARYLSSAAPGLRRAYTRDVKLTGAQRPVNLRMAVEAEEQSAQFESLCGRCLDIVTVPSGRLSSVPVGEEAWSRAVGAYLRNSGAYLSMAKSTPVDHQGLASRFVEETARDECTATYYAMLEGVALDAEEIAWGDYRLVYLGPASLLDVLDSPTRALFFDDAPADLNKLARHRFVVTSEQVAPGIGGFLRRLDRHWSNRLTVYPTEFRPPVEDALATLALYDWQPVSVDDDRAKKEDIAKQFGWMRFRVPLVVEISDDLLASPRYLPDTSQVVMTPIPGPDGEEIGERPDPPFLELDATQTQQLQESLVELQTHRNRPADVSSADFLRIATDAMLKALLSDGMEQLLWHIIAIEAVLGRDGEGESGTALLAGRVSRVLALTKRDRKKVRRKFSDLYEFRCALVHGRPPKKEAFKGHLMWARQIARAVVVWALRAFAYLQEKAGADAAFAPERGDLLRLVDMADHERGKVARYAQDLPDGFPHVGDWLR